MGQEGPSGSLSSTWVDILPFSVRGEGKKGIVGYFEDK